MDSLMCFQKIQPNFAISKTTRSAKCSNSPGGTQAPAAPPVTGEARLGVALERGSISSSDWVQANKTRVENYKM